MLLKMIGTTLFSNLDILLLSLPNRNIDYPSLSLPTISGRLREDGFNVEQSDLNVLIRDRIITCNFLNILSSLLYLI